MNSNDTLFRHAHVLTTGNIMRKKHIEDVLLLVLQGSLKIFAIYTIFCYFNRNIFIFIQMLYLLINLLK